MRRYVTLSPCHLVTLSSLCLLATGLRAQNADDPKTIVEKAIKAHGGEENLNKLQMIRGKVKGTVMIAGVPSAFTGEVLNHLPGKCKQQYTVTADKMKIEVIEVLNADKAWSIVNGQTSDIAGEQLKSLKEESYTNMLETLVPLVKDKDFKLVPLAEVMVNGKPAVGVKISSRGHHDVEFYFDKADFLLVRIVRPTYDSNANKEVTSETIYKDFKDFGGIKQGAKVLINHDGEKRVEYEMLELKLLDKVDPNEFAKTL